MSREVDFVESAPVAASQLLERLRKPDTVRQRAKDLLGLVRVGQSAYFTLNEEALKATAQQVLELTLRQYPDLNVPFHSRWRHFEAGGVERHRVLLETLKHDLPELARSAIELAVISVLLDAGAGPDWKYQETDGKTYTRSEGLAIASFDLFMSGAFANDQKSPRADSAALTKFSIDDLARGFQVSSENPLIGLEQRAELIQKLGSIYPERLGQLADELLSASRSIESKLELKAVDILGLVLERLGFVWPIRLSLGGYSLGDVWRHSAIKTNDGSSGLVPFHKLSQWLAYSLMEPLQWAGVDVLELDSMTGLPEYRNGGLLLDEGVLVPKDPQFFATTWTVGDEAIVEWRALTVALLDEIADLMRATLVQQGRLAADRATLDLPLVKVLQGGTWQAGREAAKRRTYGAPPLTITSDGTVF